MRVADNVEMLEIGGEGFAVYPTLTWDAEHLVLVDTGFPGQADDIVKAIADAGFSAGRITHIIFTHQDIDHIGNIRELLCLSPGAQVLAHETEAPYIDGRKTPVKLAEMQAHYDSLPPDQKARCDQLRENFASRRVPIDRCLRDGEVLGFCGGIEVIHTPGHTPGHISLFLKESEILVSGDALNIENGAIAGPNPAFTQDMELGLASMERAKKWPFRGMISYHCGYLKRKE